MQKTMENNNWKCRLAPSLGGGFDGHPLSAWGTPMNYDPGIDSNNPVVFFGLYGFPDFYAVWRHKGRRCILWAGSDILHFMGGYWLDDKGDIRMDKTPLARWLDKNCENYVENIKEQQMLEMVGVKSTIVPSFLGDMEKYPVSYTQADRPRVYISCGKDRQVEYGFQIIEEIADKCNVDFYLYGDTWETKHPNVIVRGRIPIEAMNAEIKNMQSGLRLNEMDGFSEILAKSILWGQYPVSRIRYPKIENYESERDLIHYLNSLKMRKEPNTEARNHYREIINKYPWNILKP